MIKLPGSLTNELAAALDLISAEVRRATLQSRSDILAALADYASAEATLQLEIAKQYPDVHISPGYQYEQGQNKWTVGITLELPVLNQNQGPIAEAEARRVEAAARFNATQAKVLAEIVHATDVYRVTQSTFAPLQSLATEQAAHRDAAEAQFKAGMLDPVDLLNAKLEFVAAELTTLEGQLKVQQALGALEDAMQRPMDLPEVLFRRATANITLQEIRSKPPTPPPDQITSDENHHSDNVRPPAFHRLRKEGRRRRRQGARDNGGGF